MSKIILAGGSGFLGQSLAEDLSARGHEAVILTRSPESVQGPSARAVRWDGRTTGPWCEELEGAAAIINLTGKNVNCRYTPENRRTILMSRLDSVRVMDEAFKRCRRPPPVLVQASSLAIYGDAGERLCTEQAAPGDDFGAQVCLQWESAVKALKLPATRVVILRIGFALGKGGGVLRVLSRLTRWFLGGAAGSGDQFISWIHVDDLNAMFRTAIEGEELAGDFNAASPVPVRNREFMDELRRVLRRPWSPPVPAAIVRLGAMLLRTEASLALTGRRCLPARFLDGGFRFQFETLERALLDIYPR
jgi:uncharacterized protein